MTTQLTEPESAHRAGDEPLPGYRLVAPLGRGGYGVVWRCTAPGGLDKAIKFVSAAWVGPVLDDWAARRETAALEAVRAIRHPFVLGLDRVEARDDGLLIVMELADRTLQDRLDERSRQGHTGIPAAELLPLAGEAAEALDLLAGLGLQHLDVKPANLFLVGGHAKVGDFSLVAPVGPRPQTEGRIAFTPRYAAPEVIDGDIAPASDQYSLALTLYELLTGRFPYPGESLNRLLIQHRNGTPDLAAAGPAAGVFARALAKRPGDRFPSCWEFTRRLLQTATGGLHQTPAPIGFIDMDLPPAADAGDEDRPPAPSPEPADTLRLRRRRVELPPGFPRTRVFDQTGLPAGGATSGPAAGKVVRAMIRSSLLDATGVAAAHATGETDVADLFRRFPVRGKRADLSRRLSEFADAHGATVSVGAGGEFVLALPPSTGWLSRLLDPPPPVEVVVTLPPERATGAGEATALGRSCAGPGGRPDARRYALAIGLLDRLRETLAEGRDMRGTTRYPVAAPVLVYPIGPDGEVGSGREGRCLDLSVGGCRVELAEDPGSDHFYLRFPTHPAASSVGLLCAVTRWGGSGRRVTELGCRFLPEG